MIEWIDKEKHIFNINDKAFRAINSLGFDKRVSTIQEMAVFKPPWMIKRYEKLVSNLKPQHIFELGIKWGGSSAFFHALSNPKKIVSIEITTDRVAALDNYIAKHQLADSLVPIYGCNQADASHLRKIIKQEFGPNSLDLVIDDASHFLDETRASFNSLFPYLRPGGAYVIEDWPWFHIPVTKPKDAPAIISGREPLTKLIFEIIMACPSLPGLISNIEIDSNSAIVWRGDQEVNADSFDIRKCCREEGRKLISEGF